jgi:hypothetical protein
MSALNPMSTFDPTLPVMVHDQRNDSTIEWKPEWADDYRKHATGGVGPGVVSWDGMLLDGWIEPEEEESDQ